MVTEVTDAFVTYASGHHKAFIEWDEGTGPAVNALLLPHDEYVFEVV